jgi:LacI family transcriptional regulator
MKDVAERAGVSVATVSRVVNQNGYVSAELQERVQSVMHALRYHPSALARSLRRRETLTIGLQLPELDHPFFSRLAFIISKILFEHGYRMLIASSEENAAQERQTIDMMVSQRVDGAIVVPVSGSQNVRLFVEQNVPIVLLDRDVPGLLAHRVFTDNHHGGFVAAQHVLAQGHRDVTIISPPEMVTSLNQRIEGVREACAAFGITPELIRLPAGAKHDSYEQGRQVAHQLLQRNARPTAVLALNDVIAVSAMRAAYDLGLNVPSDLSVVGYDDIPLARQVQPALTTMAQPVDAMGQQAVEILLHVLNEPEVALQSCTLQSTLVVRESTQLPSR